MRAGTLFALGLTTVGSSTVESPDSKELARPVPEKQKLR
jgi:hypothetical protein